MFRNVFAVTAALLVALSSHTWAQPGNDLTIEHIDQRLSTLQEPVGDMAMERHRTH